MAAPLCRARHRHLPGARQGAGDQETICGCAPGQPQARRAFRRCIRLRVCPEAVGDRRRRRGHAARDRARRCAGSSRRHAVHRALGQRQLPGLVQADRRGPRTSVPIRSVPIDILGDGFVVAPPSIGEKGPYEIIQGSLADLPALPTLKNPPARAGLRPAGPERRQDSVVRASATRRSGATAWVEAHSCDDFDALLDVARTANADFMPPLADAEVVKLPARPGTTRSAARTWSGGSTSGSPFAVSR